MKTWAHVPKLAGPLLAAAFVLAAASDGAAEQAATGSLEVRVTGLRNAKGKVWVHLWDRPAGYPSSLDKARHRRAVDVRDGAAIASFEGLQPGTYAAFAFHDEDGDGRIKANFIGMPIEGVGASKGAKGRMGPPSFKAASFDLGTDRRAIGIRLRYL